MRHASVHRRHLVIGVLAVVLLAVATRIAAEVDALTMAVAIGGLAVAATVVGLSGNGRDRTRDWKRAWWVLSAALTVSAAGSLVAAAGREPAVVGVPVSQALDASGAVIAVIGLLLLTRHRQAGRALDVLFEATTAAVATGFLAWTGFSGISATLDGGTTHLLLPLVAVVIDLVVVWIATRLIGMTDEHPTAYRYLIAAFVCLFTLDAVALGEAIGGASAVGERIAPLQLWGYCLWAAAALHPSLRTPFEPSTSRTLGITRPYMLFVGAAVLLPPAAYVMRTALGQPTDVTVVIAGSAVLPFTVAVHLMQQVQARARGEYRAQYDALTGLPNRVLFQDRLDLSLSHARRSGGHAAVMFLDLDRFKNINDSLGHDVGNELLKAVGKRLVRTLREQDTVARMGGDEFTVLLSELTDRRDAGFVAQKILDAFAEPVGAGDRELFVSPTIGVAVFPDHGADAESLLKNADTAMYRAKAQGRNTFQTYSSDMSARAQVRFALEHSLHDAIERGELSLHYQPQIDTVSGSIIGLEALARWEHPRLGHIAPGAFIPLAEESGLIQPLGEWVLETAARQNQEWLERGLLTVPMAVNVSARQFTGERLHGLITRVLRETGLPPGLLELELTESVLVRDTRTVRTLLDDLKQIGVRCSIDDFGTGFSGLNYLAQLPVDTLKIDRSFVNAIGTREVDSTIVGAIIALAMSLGLEVIAEGVETDAQAAFLRDHGCRNVQGYLYSRPLPAEALEARLVAAAPVRGQAVGVGSLAADDLPALSEGPHPSVGVSAAAVAELLLAVAANEDGTAVDADVVAAVLAALIPDGIRRDVVPWSTRASVRMAAGTFAGLMPISGGLASAGALPPAVQNVTSSVLGTIGVAIPRAVHVVAEEAVLPPLLAAGTWLNDVPAALGAMRASPSRDAVLPRVPEDVSVLGAVLTKSPVDAPAGSGDGGAHVPGSGTIAGPVDGDADGDAPVGDTPHGGPRSGFDAHDAPGWGGGGSSDATRDQPVDEVAGAPAAAPSTVPPSTGGQLTVPPAVPVVTTPPTAPVVTRPQAAPVVVPPVAVAPPPSRAFPPSPDPQGLPSDPGDSGSAPGQGGGVPGNGKVDPGTPLVAPGNSGSAPGQGGGVPGNGNVDPGTPPVDPGNSGQAPGQGGEVPGNGKVDPGTPPVAPGNSGQGVPPADPGSQGQGVPPADPGSQSQGNASGQGQANASEGTNGVALETAGVT